MLNSEASKAKIQKLITKKLLEKVVPDRAHAQKLIIQANNHLKSALLALHHDLEGSYCLIYDAARKSLTAILSMKGLRATNFGGHAVIFEALITMCEVDEIAIVGPFDKMRKRRNAVEYPQIDRPTVDLDRVENDYEKAQSIVRWAEQQVVGD